MNMTLIRLRAVAGKFGAAFLLGALAAGFAGCSSAPPKAKPIHQRGWVGGEYKLAEKPHFFRSTEAVEAFPKALGHEREKAILVTALSSNTPARLAGLRQGDLVLEVNHSPMTRLKDFRALIDRSDPGTALPMKVYRNGESIDFQVVVGRETFRHWGTFMIALPPIFRAPDLWPNPDFSLIVLGYETHHKRTELGSVESTYIRSCHADYHPWEDEWDTWLVLFRTLKSKEILSQEIVEPRTQQAVVQMSHR
jgi:PDZ domain-containing protein